MWGRERRGLYEDAIGSFSCRSPLRHRAAWMRDTAGYYSACAARRSPLGKAPGVLLTPQARAALTRPRAAAGSAGRSGESWKRRQVSAGPGERRWPRSCPPCGAKRGPAGLPTPSCLAPGLRRCRHGIRPGAPSPAPPLGGPAAPGGGYLRPAEAPGPALRAPSCCMCVCLCVPLRGRAPRHRWRASVLTARCPSGPGPGPLLRFWLHPTSWPSSWRCLWGFSWFFYYFFFLRRYCWAPQVSCPSHNWVFKTHCLKVGREQGAMQTA